MIFRVFFSVFSNISYVLDENLEKETLENHFPRFPKFPNFRPGPREYTHFCRIRDGGGAGRPRQYFLKDETDSNNKTIYHWKGNLPKSPIYFSYGKNILILQLYEQFSRNALQWLQNGCPKKFF